MAVFVVKKNLAIASYTKVREFANGKSFRRVTEEGYLSSAFALGQHFRCCWFVPIPLRFSCHEPPEFREREGGGAIACAEAISFGASGRNLVPNWAHLVHDVVQHLVQASANFVLDSVLNH